MSRAQGAAIIILLLSVLGVLPADVYLRTAGGPKAEQWEYRVEGFSDETIVTSMNVLGGEGWELASARRAISGEGSSSKGLYECIFKRKK